MASEFAVRAREKKTVSVDPRTVNRAFLLVGNEDWPFPVPLVKQVSKWYFDANGGREELLYRRIGSNQLDAIDLCRGYVEAQEEYAFQKREGYDVNQSTRTVPSTKDLGPATLSEFSKMERFNPDSSWKRVPE
jgi:hypothetical protein